MIRGVFAGLFSVGSLCLLAQIPNEKRESNNFMTFYLKAEQLVEDRRYEEALINFNQSLQLYPYYADSYFSRAALKEKLGDTEGALTDYNIYLELEPDRYEALLNRGLILFKLERWVQAEADFKKLLLLPSGETNTIYFRQDLHTGSVNQVFTAQGANAAYIYNYVGLSKMKLDELDSAIFYFDSAIYKNPNDADYYVNRGLCQQQLNLPAAAIYSFQAALEINLDHGLAKHNLSVLSRKMGEIEEAGILLSAAIERNPNLPYPFAERAYHHMQNGDFSNAILDYTQAIELAPDNAEYLLGRGIAFEKIKDWENAYDDFTKAISLDDQLEKAWLNRANLLFKLEAYKQAIEDYNVAIEIFPGYAAAYFNRALAEQKINRFPEACGDLQKAKTLEMDVPENLFNKVCGEGL